MTRHQAAVHSNPMDGDEPWWRTPQAVRVGDAVLIIAIVAAAWTVLATVGGSDTVAPLTPAMALCSLLAAIPLAWRRRWPLATFFAAFLAAGVAGAVDERGLPGLQSGIEVVVLCFALGAWSQRRVISGSLLAVVILVLIAAMVSDGIPAPAASSYAIALIAAPAVAGYATRLRRQYVEEVERRLADAERDRDERAERAVTDERARIARELHDVVAHHVSLIGVQAGAARTALERSPQEATAALGRIEESSRSAVGEMRQLLDVLSPRGPGAVRGGLEQPQPGLGLLPHLLDQWDDAGLTIDRSLVGDETVVPDTVSLCCYRIIEEALTNVTRHSAADRATVSVTVSPGQVDVDVADSGPAAAATDVDDSAAGRGLLGMAERVALFGGSLSVGEHGGGFRVAASIPWAAS